MEFFTSLKNQMINRGIKNQARLRWIHDALLGCLEVSAPLVEREDYHPGEIELSQWFSFSPFCVILRLIVSRDSVDIFIRAQTSFPELTIVRRLGWKYLLLDGFQYRTTGKLVHQNIRHVPSTVTSFRDAYFHNQPEELGVTASRIS